MRYRYPFTHEITFALVMQDLKLCRGLLQRIFPDRRIGELRFHDPTSTWGDPSDPGGVASGPLEAAPESDRSGRLRADSGDVTTERTLIAGIESRKVRLDVFFEDSSEWYDIEMQARNEHNLPRRSRYYHSISDVNSLKPGQNFGELKAGYVIFLCCFDPFDQGEAVYRFSMLDGRIDLPLGDDSYTMILNSRADEQRTPEPLRGLFRYINDAVVTEEDELVLEIDKAVQSWNAAEGGNEIMIWEQEILIKEAQARKEGRKEGRDEGIQENQKRVVRNMKADGCSEDTIARYTGLSEEEIRAL